MQSPPAVRTAGASVVSTPGTSGTTAVGITPSMTAAATKQTHSEHVSEQALEFLLSELVVYVKESCQPSADNTAQKGGQQADEEALTVAAEMAAAKLERMGYAVGYRLTERLAQHKVWQAVPNQDTAAAVASQQLEAVKFLCKDVWSHVFNKQIDKLQTNHRGVFVLKDSQLSWLTRFPAGTEQARVTAMRFLAFPCGLVRGCLSNLGIPAVVSCDFLADGQKMAACSFNIKVK